MAERKQLDEDVERRAAEQDGTVNDSLLADEPPPFTRDTFEHALKKASRKIERKER